MSKRQKQTIFLKTLILHGNAEERRRLQERIDRAQRDEQCAWRAFWLVGLLAVFSSCGICYSAVLIPEFFQSAPQVVVKIFGGLGLASMICAVTFFSFWLWCRGVLNRVHEECRRFIMAMLEPGSSAGARRMSSPRDGEPASDVSDRAADSTAFALLPQQTYAQLFSLRRSS